MKKKKQKQKKKFQLSTVILIVIFLLGVALLLYPTVANLWNQHNASSAIADYSDTVENTQQSIRDQMLREAHAYNESLKNYGNMIMLDEKEEQTYTKILSLDGNSMMAYLEIPRISVSLPIYHGVSESVLSSGIGHIPGSSMPVGGEGTHCILSGHRGLPSARLLTDLDQMEVGDYFIINILGDKLTYEVDQIRIVLPQELDQLQLEPGQDLCTLVTCTPYGINTHRLLVRGHHVDNVSADSLLMLDARQIEPFTVASIGAAVAVIIMLLWMIMRNQNRTGISRRRRRRKKSTKKIITERFRGGNNEK